MRLDGGAAYAALMSCILLDLPDSPAGVPSKGVWKGLLACSPINTKIGVFSHFSGSALC